MTEYGGIVRINNNKTVDDQAYPRGIPLPDGGFLIVYEEWGSGFDINTIRFDEDSNRLTNTATVHPAETDSGQGLAVPVHLNNGNIAIMYYNNTGTGENVVFSLLDSDLTVLLETVLINTNTTGF